MYMHVHAHTHTLQILLPLHIRNTSFYKPFQLKSHETALKINFNGNELNKTYSVD